MWFYVLYLKFSGHLFGSWSECCTKLLSPRLHWDDLKWPLMILPHCKFKEAVAVVLTLPQFLLLKLTKDTYHRPELTPRRDPKPKSKPLNKILKIMALMAEVQVAIGGTNMQLKSEMFLKQNLRKFKRADGSLNTNRLSSHPSHKALHQALISKIREDTAAFHSCIGQQLKVVNAVVDTGDSSTSPHTLS